jgi:diguanylate cyclase (GGDEF)-like protein
MSTQESLNGKEKNRVLVVDDSPTSSAMVEGLLGDAGYSVRSASSGAEGIEIVKAWAPSVILLDLVMPEMGGMEVVAAVRGREQPRRPTIINVSGESKNGTVVDALSNGADDFVIKPFNESELLARILSQLRISDFYREVEEDNRSLETILDITSAITATLDPTEVLDIIVKRVASVMKADRCSIVLVAREDEGYILAAHDNPEVHDQKVDLGKYPEITEAIDKRQPVILEDMVNDPLMSKVKGNIQDLKEMSVLIVPIVIEDVVLGTLFLRTKRKESGFTKKEVDFCQVVANSSFHSIRNARLFTQIVQEKAELAELAITDQLTTLYNHNYFYKRLSDELERAGRYETAVALLMMDIDDFKQINDTHGHRTGDTVLRDISARIKGSVRKTDIVARYGGEEFVIILPHTTLKGGMEEAERLREIVASQGYGGLPAGEITMSFGVAARDKVLKDASVGELVSEADDALYQAKRGGKNCIKHTP